MKTNSLKSEGSPLRGSGGRDLMPQRSLGSKIVIPTTYGGLGYRFFEQLSFETDKILQVIVGSFEKFQHVSFMFFQGGHHK